MAIEPESNRAFRLYQELVQRAWSDPAFKQRLQDDPRGTLQQEIAAAGLNPDLLPKDVKFFEESEKTAYFCLPKKDGAMC